MPNEFVMVVNVLLPEDDVAVATAVGDATAVGAAAGPTVSIVVRICVTCVISGLMPLSRDA
jgi:hypothetical protein